MLSIPLHENWVFHENDPYAEPLFINENGRALRSSPANQFKLQQGGRHTSAYAGKR